MIMCVTTFVTQKQIMKRSGPVEGQAATVQKLLLYGMPMSLFVSGFFFPIGVLLYWMTNNLWTLGQQFFILRKLPPPGSDAHKAKAAAEKPVDRPATLAPKPGAKPVRPKPAGRVPPPPLTRAADATARRRAPTAAARPAPPPPAEPGTAGQAAPGGRARNRAGRRTAGSASAADLRAAATPPARPAHRPPGTPGRRPDLGGTP